MMDESLFVRRLERSPHLPLFVAVERFGGTTLNPQNSRSWPLQLATPPSIWILIACEPPRPVHPVHPWVSHAFKFYPKSA